MYCITIVSEVIIKIISDHMRHEDPFLAMSILNNFKEFFYGYLVLYLFN